MNRFVRGAVSVCRRGAAEDSLINAFVTDLLLNHFLTSRLKPTAKIMDLMFIPRIDSGLTNPLLRGPPRNGLPRTGESECPWSTLRGGGAALGVLSSSCTPHPPVCAQAGQAVPLGCTFGAGPGSVNCGQDDVMTLLHSAWTVDSRKRETQSLRGKRGDRQGSAHRGCLEPSVTLCPLVRRAAPPCPRTGTAG